MGQVVLATPEDIIALAADNPADKAAAQPRRTDDAPDGDTFGGHAPNHLVRLLSALKTVVLQPLGRGAQSEVQFRHPGSAADRRHLPPRRRIRRSGRG